MSRARATQLREQGLDLMSKGKTFDAIELFNQARKIEEAEQASSYRGSSRSIK